MAREGVRVHRSSNYYGKTARRCDPTTKMEADIIHRVIAREIYADRCWVIKFAEMGSKVCRKIAQEKGWHKGKWYDANSILTTSDEKEKQRMYCRQYYWKDHAKSLERSRIYRERLRAERAALKKEKEREV